MTKIKICGLTRIEDIEAVNIAMPDYIGFVFVEGRKRTVTSRSALSLKERLNKNIKGNLFPNSYYRGWCCFINYKSCNNTFNRKHKLIKRVWQFSIKTAD